MHLKWIAAIVGGALVASVAWHQTTHGALKPAPEEAPAKAFVFNNDAPRPPAPPASTASVAGVVVAGVHKCKSRSGTVTYGDRPCTAGSTEVGLTRGQTQTVGALATPEAIAAMKAASGPKGAGRPHGILAQEGTGTLTTKLADRAFDEK